MELPRGAADSRRCTRQWERRARSSHSDHLNTSVSASASVTTHACGTLVKLQIIVAPPNLHLHPPSVLPPPARTWWCCRPSVTAAARPYRPVPVSLRSAAHNVNDEPVLGAMTSRPGPGIHEQSRGSGVPSRNPNPQVRRRPSKPLNTALPPPDCIDPALDGDRASAYNGAGEPPRPLPRGRPQLFYGNASSDGYELPVSSSFPYQPTANLPVPPRPGSVHLGDASNQRRIVPGGSGVKEYPNAQAPEVLSAPVHFPGGKAADVFPWTGNNPEDTLTEALVKVGISNKPQIMNETNTARPSLWSNLKNKSGLSTLSTLFVAVLEKRQQTGRLQEPNTFKPPPRLTLRDTAREQWLYDLSNPAVGLRRLSRTIPHGLTGKVLLEQCLNKNIPLPRALWLARCVGINELRAHKRKGQAGTVTWVRGWTSSVEQFLDSILSGIGTGEWKQRITYSWVTIAPGDN